MGATPSDELRLSGYKGHHTITTTTDQAPQPALRAPAASHDLDISWLLKVTTREFEKTAHEIMPFNQ